MKFETREAFEKVNMFGIGAENIAYARFFAGDSFLNPLTDPECGLFAANVTFAPGCETTGISIMQIRAAASFCFARQEKAGIRRLEGKPLSCMKAAS